MKHPFSVVLMCLVFVTFSAAVAMADLMQGLVGYWPLDDGSGGIARDASGKGHNGTLDNGPVWTADAKIGTGALLFDGKDDRVSIKSFDVEGGDGITISCWFNASNASNLDNDPRIVSKAVGGNNEQHWFMLSSSREGGIKILRFRLKTDDDVTSEKKAHPDGTIELDVWIHAAVTWDGSTMLIYKNGVEVGSMAKAGKLAVDPSVNMAIGSQPDGVVDTQVSPFEGIIDDVAIWNRALTVDEIAEMMANGLPALAVEPGGKLATVWGAIKY